MSYDPKLRAAMKEIDDVLKKYDIGAVIGLQSESHTEFKMHLEPRWSLVRFVRDGKAVHVKLHHSKQPQLDQTCAMIYSFRDLVALFFSQLNGIAELIEKHSKVTHKKLSAVDIDNSDRADEASRDR